MDTVSDFNAFKQIGLSVKEEEKAMSETTAIKIFLPAKPPRILDVQQLLSHVRIMIGRPSGCLISMI
jgi:hypothetical protein